MTTITNPVISSNEIRTKLLDMSSLYTIYAIRQISTGHYLPTARNRHTTQDPLPWDSNHIPRFFKSRRAASAALSAWARGIWEQHEASRGSCGGYESPEYYDYYAPKDCGRKKEDMGVVEFNVTEINQYITQGDIKP